MADSKNIYGRGPYEAIGKVIRKLPVETKVEGYETWRPRW